VDAGTRLVEVEQGQCVLVVVVVDCGHQLLD
jgi:hypothetical protein